MATVEERMKVLNLIEDGKISAEEGARLLAALDKSRGQDARTRRTRRTRDTTSSTAANGRWVRIRVSDTNTGKTRVNMTLPFSLVNMGLAMGARFVPDMVHLDMEEIQDALRSGMRGKVLEVKDDGGELVEIFVE